MIDEHATQFECVLEDADLLVTVTIAIARDGHVHQSTRTHGNPWPEVYRGMHAVKHEIDRLIGERRQCPFNPKNQKGEP